MEDLIMALRNETVNTVNTTNERRNQTFKIIIGSVFDQTEVEVNATQTVKEVYLASKTVIQPTSSSQLAINGNILDGIVNPELKTLEQLGVQDGDQVLYFANLKGNK